MKILFLVYHGISEVSGISKKIHYQVKGLREIFNAQCVLDAVSEIIIKSLIRLNK